MIIRNYLQDPFKYAMLSLSAHGLLKWVPDKIYLRLMYRAHMGQKLDLKGPKTFNEKLQWLKLYDRNPLYTTMVDKYAVKQYVAERIGQQHLIPTLGIWERFEDIDFASLPDQFVLKTTHDSGGIVICTDKRQLDLVAAQEKMQRCLQRNYYRRSREWPYKNVKPRIIAEAFMTDESGAELKDYKIFNFGGVPKLIQLDFDRFCGHKRNLYSVDWKRLDVEYKYPGDARRFVSPPDGLDEMLELARVLSGELPFVRTDFYIINGKIYFGELTFFPEGGFGSFSSDELALQLGEQIILPAPRA